MNKVRQKLAAGQVVAMFNPEVDIVRYARPRDHADKIFIIMVETPAAIERIDEIAAVPGVDVINIGVNDVARALGYPGQPEHPEVTAALERGISRVVKAGKTAGLNVLTNWEERMPWLLSRGVRWLNVRTNNIISDSASGIGYSPRHRRL